MNVLTVRFEPIYSWQDDPEIKATNVAKQAARHELVLSIVPDLSTPAGSYASYDGLVLSTEQYIAFLSAGEKFDESKVTTIPTGNNAFKTVAERASATPSPEQAHNAVTHVHVAGQVLSSYNRVHLLSDACTDDLQSKLNEGWRIVACCVPPYQRRPDYILGRWEP